MKSLNTHRALDIGVCCRDHHTACISYHHFRVLGALLEVSAGKGQCYPASSDQARPEDGEGREDKLHVRIRKGKSGKLHDGIKMGWIDDQRMGREGR